MKIKLLNGTYTEADKVNAYTTLDERAYAGYSQCDPLDIYRYEVAAEQEAERKEADTGMRYRSWLELVNGALDVPDAERLLAEIGGPTWIEAYTPDECVRICKAAVAVAGDGIRGLLAFLGTSQAAFADRYLIPRRSVENWCTRSEINHRDCPAYVVSLLSYAALRDAGII